MGVINHQVTFIVSTCLTSQLLSSVNPHSYMHTSHIHKHTTPEHPVPKGYLGQRPKKVLGWATQVSVWCPIGCSRIVKRLLIGNCPCYVFLLDDSVCSLFWLCLVTGLQCAVWASAASPLTVMAEHCRVEKPQQPTFTPFCSNWK